MLELANKRSEGYAKNGGHREAQAGEPFPMEGNARLARVDAVASKEVDEISRCNVQVNVLQVEQHRKPDSCLNVLLLKNNNKTLILCV